MSNADQSSELFQQLRDAEQAGGAAEVLDRLAKALSQQGKYHEQFEALKMQVRRRLGLPLLYGDLGDDLDEDRRRQLEEGLIAACREIGALLLGEGRVREGWMYMRAVGDKPAMRETLAGIEPDDENIEELIEVLLNEGVDVARGFDLTLDRYGTCNAITTFDNMAPALGKPDRLAAARLLLNHLHGELLESVKAHIAKEEGSAPAGESVADLLADRDWLLAGGGYHVDTSHLASAVRHARALADADSWRVALDLTEYGRQLAAPLKYDGDEPFVDQFPTSAMYFRALLGENVDEALEYFRGRAEEVEKRTQGTQAAEVYVDLLARLGRHDEAITALLEHIPPGTHTAGLAPSLVELCHAAGNYEPMCQATQERGDLLGYAMGLLKASSEKKQ